MDRPIDPETPEIKIARLQEQITALACRHKEELIEIRRRLDELNHARAESVLDRTQFLPISAHDRFYEEYKHWRDETNKVIGYKLSIEEFGARFSEYVHWRDGVNETLANWSGRTYAAFALLGVVFTVIQIAIHYWKP